MSILWCVYVCLCIGWLCCLQDDQEDSFHLLFLIPLQGGLLKVSIVFTDLLIRNRI